MLSQYGKRNVEWREAIDTVRNAIATCKVQLASHYRVPPIVHLFDMTNNFDYYNTNQFTLTAEPPRDEVSPMIATTELARLAETTTEPPQMPNEIDLPE